MNTISLKLNEEQINKLKQTFKDDISPSNNQYVDTLIKTLNCQITIYKTSKVLFQGKDAHIYASAFITKKIAMAGSDEVGTGDYFGPVVVVAAIVNEEDYAYLEDLDIKDSKQLTDEKILQIGSSLKEHIKHSVLILDNPLYNKVHQTNNMNQIKAKLHNQAYINLINKGYKIPSACYIDEFAPKELYYRYLIKEKAVFDKLTFETKAENKYIAVACASIIARYTFLKCMEQMNKKYDFDFPLGAGDIVDKKAALFIKKYSVDKLNEVAKVHFKNTEKAIKQI